MLDLLNGQTVHAIKGERARYQPIKSVLCNTPDPLAVARAFRDRLGLNEVYIADLNAIQYSGKTIHREVITALALRENLDIILDAGIPNLEDAKAWLDCGVRKVAIGSETLRAWDALQSLPTALEPDRLIFSLDFQSGKILSQCPLLAATPPLQTLNHLYRAGWREVILLDLSRVGSEKGVDYELAAKAQALFPELQLLIGGGISTPEELLELKSAGVSGVLTATALHKGIIDSQFISGLQEKK